MRYQSKPVDSMPLMAPEDTFKEKTQTNSPHHPTSTDAPQEATLEYNVALACSLDEVKAFGIDSFVIAETEKEKSPLNSWVKSRGSDDISTILSTPILVNEPKTLLYQFPGSKKSALIYDNVLPVKKGSAVYRDVFIPVKPSVQVDERLGWPTEGYFYHFVDDELTHEYKIAGNNKWGFNVTESTKEGFSDEIIVSKPQSTILLPYKIDNQVIARQHLLYRKEKLSQDLLLDEISAEWLDEYACLLDMDVVFSTRTASILEKEKEQDGKVIYIIKSGDNLSKVAHRQGVTLEELLTLNPRYKDSPDNVNVGDEIIIEVIESYNVEPEYHTCQLDTKTNQRETWSSIAALYNLSAKSLLGMNPDYDADPSALSLGDKLQVTLPKESSGQSSVRSALPAEDVTTSKTAFAHSNVQCEVSSKTHCNVHPIVGDSGADKNTPVVKVKQLIMHSEPLSTSDKLELLASGDGEALSKGSKGIEVKAIQDALIDLGFDLGPAGADGDFGKATESAIKQFQKAYEPTHTTHKNYQIGEVDGVVDKNMILALDEAVVLLWILKEDKVNNWAESSFGEILGSVESKNDYSAYNRTKGGLKAFFKTQLTTFTVSEVIAKQQERSMFAVGRFQIIPSTLSEAVEYLSINKNDVFDKKIQDRIFNEFLIKKKRPQIIAYLEGSGSVEDAIYAWAKEFASAGVEKGRKISRDRIAKGGESYYAGDGLNKAHLTPEKMKETLITAKKDSVYHD
ncbi:LysM peptidoglycan-binding domain-containing protein [Vibrio sp. 1S139]|uniref:LysM peptidoglycan-binding domain-containing protein n=1 Tax=Vibrio sp. 1S139 TaxID=3230006 RepID=UPI00352E4AC5